MLVLSQKGGESGILGIEDVPEGLKLEDDLCSARVDAIKSFLFRHSTLGCLWAFFNEKAVPSGPSLPTSGVAAVAGSQT